jgi:cbb3-type cytochrome oxidase subunit 3
VDAAYEGLMKRTFVAMIVLLVTHLPFLVGIVFMYRKLGSKPKESAFKESEEENDDSETDMDTSELLH